MQRRREALSRCALAGLAALVACSRGSATGARPAPLPSSAPIVTAPAPAPAPSGAKKAGPSAGPPCQVRRFAGALSFAPDGHTLLTACSGRDHICSANGDDTTSED